MKEQEIDIEIKRLQNLKYKENAKTFDGVPIEVGGMYYELHNLGEGFEEVVPLETWQWHERGIYEPYNPKDQYSYTKNHFYDQMHSTKKSAFDRMKTFLENSIIQHENNIKNSRASLELLAKLEDES